MSTILNVRDHLEAVHSISLINVYLDLENPRGVGILGGGVQKGY
jgi:hypothetical protein